MAKKKKHDHAGGHGWFVTFADLMGLLMSFFVVLVASSTQNVEQLKAVLGSMREAFGSQSQVRLTGIMEVDGLPTRSNPKQSDGTSDKPSVGNSGPTRDDEVNGVANRQQKDLALAAATLRQALAQMPDFAEMANQLIVEDTPSGVNITIIDADGRSMFPKNSAQPSERVLRALAAVAPALRRLPNMIVVTGHAAAGEEGTNDPDAWRLTADRAEIVYDLLVNAGIPTERFEAIVARGKREPLLRDGPELSANRRVTISLQSSAPAIGAGALP